MIKIINCDLMYLGPNPTGGHLYKVTDGTLSIEMVIHGTLTDAVKKKIAINFDKSKRLISERLKKNAKN